MLIGFELGEVQFDYVCVLVVMGDMDSVCIDIDFVLVNVKDDLLVWLLFVMFVCWMGNLLCVKMDIGEVFKCLVDDVLVQFEVGNIVVIVGDEVVVWIVWGEVVWFVFNSDVG